MRQFEESGAYNESRHSSQIDEHMARMRTSPMIFDYCYFTAKCNLAVIRSIASRAQPGDTVIDVGCGNKAFSRLFPDSVNYVGLDWAGEAHADVVCDVSRGLPLANESADILILSECLEHLPDTTKVFSEIHRVLRPGGQLFISTPFAFPIHGRPHDYYRFTEHFYRQAADSFGLVIDQLEYSNTAPIAPLISFQNLFMPAPLIPFPVKQVVFAICNIVAAVPEWLSRLAARRSASGRVAGYLASSPAGYALIMSKAS